MSPVPIPPVDVMDRFDQDLFLARYWDRRPVLIPGSGLGPAPFDAHEVFEGAVIAAQRPAADRVGFTLGPRLLRDPGDLLPQPEDGSFARYDRRLLRQVEREPFALLVRGLHTCHHPVWLRARAFLAQLWDRVGQPLLGATTTLFHGTTSPGRLPYIRGATFLYTLLGHPRIRLGPDGQGWSARPEPGDLLYWPAGLPYAAEPCSPPAAAVHLGVGRTAPRPGEGLRQMLAPGSNPASPQGRWGGDDIHVREEDGLHGLPPVLAEALAHHREAARPAALERSLARQALRHATDGGLRPVPPPARPGYFTDDDAVRAVERVLWTEAAGRRLVAACGHTLETDLTAPELSALLGLLNSGAEVAVGELTPPARSLLSRLAGFRAVVRL
ncbi:hypothetical protein ACIBUY_37925 [Streptomyces sp. NPDC050085]|uniref:hypothetical protein n=1 Tax=Streptomyces sp. NPDC050085 TaxID=3365600 RepID=UPI0037A816E3